MNCPVIDCHCHVYPAKIAAKATQAIGDFYSIPMNCDGTVEGLLEKGKRAGVTHHLVFSVATKPSQTRSINEFIAKTVAEHPGLMTGLGTVHPDSEDLEGDIEHLISLGLKGVKLHHDMQGFKIDDYRCLKIYELCEGRIPVMLHTGDSRFDFSNPNRLKPILDIFTGLTVIAAHFGGWSIWEEAAAQLKNYEKLYVDCSSSFFAMNYDTALGFIRAYGADKVMFGSDYPMWEAEKELEYFSHLDLSTEEREKILYKNAVKVFGINI